MNWNGDEYLNQTASPFLVTVKVNGLCIPENIY